MKKIKFLRTQTKKHSKLGKNRKKLQKWRRPKGRDSKIRENRAGRPKSPGVGYKGNKKDYKKIEGKTPKIIRNLNDLEKTGKDSVLIIGKIGAKKKIEIVKKAFEMKLRILNFKGERKNAIK